MGLVTVKQHSIETGYSEDAIYKKIQRGVWQEDIVWFRAPDGRILIDQQGYIKWATGQLVTNTTASKPRQNHRLKSTSITRERDVESGSRVSPPPLIFGWQQSSEIRF